MSRETLTGKEATLIGLAAGCLLVIMSLTGVYEGIRAERKHGAIETWPSCQAVVEASQARPFHRGKHNEGSLYFETAITYRYRVNNVPYHSSYFGQGHNWQLGYPPSFDSREEADKFLLSYRPGSRITVYVNPEQPREAVIDRAYTAYDSGKRGIMILSFFAAGLILIMYSLFRRRQLTWKQD